jgi:hypothetical protein
MLQLNAVRAQTARISLHPKHVIERSSDKTARPASFPACPACLTFGLSGPSGPPPHVVAVAPSLRWRGIYGCVPEAARGKNAKPEKIVAPVKMTQSRALGARSDAPGRVLRQENCAAPGRSARRLSARAAPGAAPATRRPAPDRPAPRPSRPWTASPDAPPPPPGRHRQAGGAATRPGAPSAGSRHSSR